MIVENFITDDIIESSDVINLAKLQSITVKQRLNQINCMRAKRIDDHIALSQLVVCENQSAEKSSVLANIIRISFS